jgi:hypothetical protein
MRAPFMIDPDQPTGISFSGGRSSAYMLWRILDANGGLPEHTRVCFANTGKEAEATLRFVRNCGERWRVPITWIEYRDDPTGWAVVDFATASRKGEPQLDRPSIAAETRDWRVGVEQIALIGGKARQIGVTRAIPAKARTARFAG